MSKTDQLWEAIGNIDDSIVEECSGKRPWMTRIPWGTIASAACLCLVIGSLVVMRGLGLLSPATQPTQPTTVPVTSTQPAVDVTMDTMPPVQTVPHNTLPTPELQMYNDLFGDPSSWYNAALRCEYATPEDISLLMLFYHGFEGESQKPTDEEWAQLKDIEGFNENYDLLRLPVRKMDAILTELFGISLADVKPEGFEGLTYLESTDCWYHMTTSIRYADFTAQNVEPTRNGTKVYYDGGYKGNMVVTVQSNGEGYCILSNLPMDSDEQARIDKITALFGEEGSWYNMALTSCYSSVDKVSLECLFHNMETPDITGEEMYLLTGEDKVIEQMRFIRLSKDMMNEVLLPYFGITVDKMDSSAFEGMTYLESTGCWYIVTQGWLGTPEISVLSVTDLPEDRIQVNYQGGNPEGTYSMVLQPNGDGYQILYNMPADTKVPTTKPTMPETEVMQDIEKAWKKRTGEELEWYTDNLWVGMRYYGSYDGYEILFYPTESVTDMFAELTVGGCSFWHSDTFEIYAYRDGKFRTLLDAYDSGDISGDSVAAIYEIHKPFEKL